MGLSREKEVSCKIRENSMLIRVNKRILDFINEVCMPLYVQAHPEFKNKTDFTWSDKLAILADYYAKPNPLEKIL